MAIFSDQQKKVKDAKKQFSEPKKYYGMLPDDKETEEWFTENIGPDCSASSAIFKFRQYLKQRWE